MTNRELLEFAAKAAGYDVIPHPNSNRIDTLFFVLKGRNWNPLDDDGDALRLAVKLRLSLDWSENESIYATDRRYDSSSDDITNIWESVNHDPYAAIRRAIVRAAAEIGKSMK